MKKTLLISCLIFSVSSYAGRGDTCSAGGCSSDRGGYESSSRGNDCVTSCVGSVCGSSPACSSNYESSSRGNDNGNGNWNGATSNGGNGSVSASSTSLPNPGQLKFLAGQVRQVRLKQSEAHSALMLKEKELSEAQKELLEAKEELAARQFQLTVVREARLELSTTKSALDLKEEQLSGAMAELESLKAQLAELQATIQKRDNNRANLEKQLMAECYVAPNGQICTKAQLIEASKELTDIILGLFTGDIDVIISSATIDIAFRLFGLDTAQLGCAIAKKAPAEPCKTAGDIKNMEDEIKRFEVEFQKMKQESDAVEKAIKEIL